MPKSYIRMFPSNNDLSSLIRIEKIARFFFMRYLHVVYTSLFSTIARRDDLAVSAAVDFRKIYINYSTVQWRSNDFVLGGRAHV